jgi:hypothetical protein
MTNYKDLDQKMFDPHLETKLDWFEWMKISLEDTMQ